MRRRDVRCLDPGERRRSNGQSKTQTLLVTRREDAKLGSRRNGPRRDGRVRSGSGKADRGVAWERNEGRRQPGRRRSPRSMEVED